MFNLTIIYFLVLAASAIYKVDCCTCAPVVTSPAGVDGAAGANGQPGCPDGCPGGNGGGGGTGILRGGAGGAGGTGLPATATTRAGKFTRRSI